ncbi:MAG TPA: hypothetical protein VG651_07355 [Stellaceae bacterium]|nr:hypothetical protein [Stellaceae bacterium]
MAQLSCRVIAVIVLMSLAACSGQPWTMLRSPDQITLRWWNDEVAGGEANSVANAYCTQMGKAVLLDGVEQVGSASIGRYRCL